MTISRKWSPLAAAAALALMCAPTLGCEKQDTTPPDEGDAAADGDDGGGDDSSDADAGGDDSSDPDGGMISESDESSMLTKSSFEATLNDHFSEVSDCYVAALETSPDAKGTLKASFKISADGKVLELNVVEGSTLTDEGFVECLTNSAKSWDFPKPSAEMTLEYPFTLEPG